MANSQEHALHYPLGAALPEPGRALDVVERVRWVRMKLPFALDHINVWLLRDDVDGCAGLTIVDCGIDDPATRAGWEQVFAHELQGLPVQRVLVTHMHPDHIGLAHWLTERWSQPERECRLWMSASDFYAARTASLTTSVVGGEGAALFFGRNGLTDPVSLERVRARRNHYQSLVPKVPERFHRLMQGRSVQLAGHAWNCLAGYGHAPEHMALFCPTLKVLISGDMVLPRISTNVSVSNLEPEGNPLALYLASIEQLRSLPRDTLVLPSHGRPFIGLHERIDQLIAHHDERFAEVLGACASAPCSAADLLAVLFKRELDLHQTTFAMGESIAHLHALAARGQLQPRAGSDGVLRYVCTQM